VERCPGRNGHGDPAGTPGRIAPTTDRFPRSDRYTMTSPALPTEAASPTRYAARSHGFLYHVAPAPSRTGLPSVPSLGAEREREKTTLLRVVGRGHFPGRRPLKIWLQRQTSPGQPAGRNNNARAPAPGLLP